MAKSAKGDNSGKVTDLEAFVSFPGIDTQIGTIVEADENGVTFQYNRYGSKYTELIPAARLIACVGSKTSEESQIWFKSNAKTLFDKGKRDRGIPMTMPKAIGNGLLKASSPDFPIIILAAEFTEIVGKSTEGSGRGRKKSKPAKEKSDKKSAKPAKAGRKNSKRDWDE